jgi:23S rRNA (uracil1939-C5)-methyltransferase
LNLLIDKLIYGGDGLARLPADDQGRGKAVFVPFTLEGETVAATLTEQKPGFARAQLDQVLTLSPNRIAPLCPYFERCGGCHYQHTSYEHQLAIKSGILRETLRRQGKLELANEIIVHPSEPWRYRNRTRFQVRTSPEFLTGYFRFASHEVLPVEDCPISSPLINRALKALWQLGRGAEVPAELREIEFFANADDTRLLAELWFTAETPAEKRIALGENFTNRLRDELPDLTSAYVFPQMPTGGPQALAEPAPDWALGGGQFRYLVGATEFRVSGGSFFQVNRFMLGKLVELVTAGTQDLGKKDIALDLYAGVGLFTAALAPSFRHIVSVESSQSSAADLKYNCPANGKIVRATVEEYLTGQSAGQPGANERNRGVRGQQQGRKPQGAKLQEGQFRQDKLRQGKTQTAKAHPPLTASQAVDFVLVDPPRAGLGDGVAQALAKSSAPRITYVSCDPATLARDLMYLTAGGYHVEQVHLVDLFPQTFHLESVVHLVR